jgi:fatty acid desaturase
MLLRFCRENPCNIPIPETYSYGVILNALTYNVGYRNEHHKFPAVPWSRFSSLPKLAKEVCEPLTTPTNPTIGAVEIHFLWTNKLAFGAELSGKGVSSRRFMERK